MKDVSKIINEIPKILIKKGEYNNLKKECDKVFVERLLVYKQALKLKFWKNHFELEGFSDFPEISGHILDFGCGSGHLDILLARRGFNITGVDASPVGIGICEYLKNKEPKKVAENLNFIEVDITKNKHNDLIYDSVWSTQVFEHIKDPKPIIEGIRQYVSKGAFFLICVPFEDAYDDPGHCNHFYSRDDIFNFLSPHIEVVRILIDEEFRVIRALCKF